MRIINLCNKVIEYSFYSLFLLVPIIFSGSPSELFEFPKMWFTFGVTVLLGTAWFAKMILQKQFRVQRTPLDIPILLFLLSQIISTVFSLDSHVSLWGYYSRFNGGLLSIISYIFLYYAFVSNFTSVHVLKLLKVSLFAGLFVAAWGLPSHFGIDPTCYVFRQTFDTSCWTDAFKPTVRIFSTLGQPAWLAAYISILIPLAISFSLLNFAGNKWKIVFYSILALLFYATLTYTDTRGGFIGFWIGNLVFFGILYLTKILQRLVFLKYLLIINLLFILFNFFQGIPFSPLSRFTLPEIIKNTQNSSPQQQTQNLPTGTLGGTDSGKIRLLVWRGAIDAWKDYPLFGTGVETFAYAYYKYRPLEHNLTSEWDYLYNKAHNEYLNYLTTTGIFGLGSYVAIIGTFLFVGIKKLKTQNSKLKNSSQNSKVDNHSYLLEIGNLKLLILALLSAYISVLVSNFFGFSVVIINLYFFLIPAFVFVLGKMLNLQKALVFPNRELRIKNYELTEITKKQWAFLVAVLLTSCFLLLSLINYYRADIAYAKGSGYSRGGAIQEGYAFLVEAVSLKNSEPVYKDELSLTMGTIAAALYLQKDASTAAQLAQESIAVNDNVISDHPNNVVFWKNRIRLFYTLAQGDPANEKKYFSEALIAAEKAQALAPNDAKIAYNLAVLTSQTGDTQKAINILEQTIKLKHDYRDAHFALGLYYDGLGVRQKAIESMQYILKNINPEDEQAKETLESWK